MENDDATVGTILSRREALARLGNVGLVLAAGGLTRLASAAAQEPKPKVHLVASPALTEGPFFVDEDLNRSDLIAGTTRPSVMQGLPLLLGFTVYKLSGTGYKPLKDVHVDVWQADIAGVYSDESNPMNHENTRRETWLRGYQVTDAAGMVQFKTIFPGWYPGRCPHIHFKVRSFSAPKRATAEFTSQVFFHDADADRIYGVEPYASRTSRQTTNENDGVFSELQYDGSAAGSHMLLDLAKAPSGKGHKTNFAIVLTDTF